MAAEKPYISIIHDDPELQTVADFVDDNATSLALNFVGKESELLDYKGDTNLTNRQRIILMYDGDQLTEHVLGGNAEKLENKRTKTSDAQLPINVGTEILIPKDKIALNNLYTVSLEPNDTNKFTTFVSENLRALLNSDDYRNVYKAGKYSRSVDFYPQINVWMWVRTLDQFIDISPFVQQLSTVSQDNGGAFDIVLAPILCKKGQNGQWNIRQESIYNYNSNSLKNSYSAQSKLFNVDDKGQLIQSQYYFHNIINSNDLVFIRYETLEMEKDDQNKDQQKFNVSPGDIPGNVYDMIGFIDGNNIQISPQNGEIAIRLSGRDLTKTILDDGSYFYIQEFASAIFPEREDTQRFRDRIYGRLVNFTTAGYRSIEDSINLVINRLSSTGYVPNDVFQGYGNRRNRIIAKDDSQQRVFKENEKQLKEVSIDLISESRVKNNLVLSSNDEEQNAIEDTFDTILSLIQDNNLQENGIITQEALVQLDQSLFDRDLLLSDELEEGGIENSAINSVQAYNTHINKKPQIFVDTPFKQGVWQIIDIEVDPSVSNVRIANSSISEANGSLISTFQQFCDEPFVEFFTDTYQDRFKFIARRPPFNFEAWKELVDLAIDIENEDLISYNLSFDDEQVYSYYILRPQAFLYGGLSQFSLAYLPAVVFQEYVDIWGSKPFDKVTNYNVYAPKFNDQQINFDRRQIIRDLKYMVDTHAYLPFTRRGQVVINGDRRIKKNTCIRLKATGEICYVTNVQNSYTKTGNIDRTTTLAVERCMVEKYIIPKTLDGFDNKISYFNIVKTDFDEKIFQSKGFGQALNINVEEGPQSDAGTIEEFSTKMNVDILKDWEVIKNNDGQPEVFNFFLNRRQFD